MQRECYVKGLRNGVLLAEGSECLWLHCGFNDFMICADVPAYKWLNV